MEVHIISSDSVMQTHVISSGGIVYQSVTSLGLTSALFAGLRRGIHTHQIWPLPRHL